MCNAHFFFLSESAQTNLLTHIDIKQKLQKLHSNIPHKSRHNEKQMVSNLINIIMTNKILTVFTRT